MSYIGRTPIVGNFVKLDTITTSATATYNLLNGGVSYYPQSANNCIVSLNGVIQSPTSAYTISGSTIVFSDALTSSDTIDFILVLGDVLNLGTPSDNTVSLAKLTATGTKDATTLLKGNNTFGLVTPNNISTDNAQLRFMAATTSTTTLTTQNVFYKTTWNQQLIDNFNEFDPTTNYRFTASEAGTYLFNCFCSFRLNSDQDIAFLAYYKNGSASSNTDVYKSIIGSADGECYMATAYKVTLAATDYIEIFAKWTSLGSSREFNNGAIGGEAIWTGWKIA